MVSTRQSSSVANGAEGTACSSGPVDVSGIKTRQASHMSPSQELVPTPAPTPPLKVVTPAKQFLDLPVEIFDKIFSYTGYKTVSTLRLVSRQMDKICGSVLNSTFQKLQTQMLHRFQTIKAKMPRRESARRNHPLACESDIIETLHMRLTLLQMSFGKHIERKHCCFFPGEILDEVYRILHYVRVTPKLARPYRVTDELYDLSTMAMEYFKEHIEPRLPEIAYFGSDFFEFPGSLQSTSNNKSWMLESPPHSGIKSEYESSGAMDCRSSETPQHNSQSDIFLQKRIKKIKQGMKKYNTQLAVVKKELKSCKAKMLEQQKQYHEHVARMDDYEKKNDETSRKFSTLLQELNKCKTELQYWRSKSPLSSLCASCGKRNEMSPEELMLIAQGVPQVPSPSVLEDPQPSTSTSSGLPSAMSSSSWITPCVPPPPPTTAVETTDDLKPKPSVPTKRKSSSDTPASHPKRSKKPRPMLKVRPKRS